MWPFNDLRLAIKLTLLAGVPVLGALLLSLLIARDAQNRAASAAGLGSIQDLAELTVLMAEVIHANQSERAQLALSAGQGNTTDPNLDAACRSTDRAISDLDRFLSHRELRKLPSSLGGALTKARESIEQRGAVRSMDRSEPSFMEKVLTYYGTIDETLISATAALTQVSEDAEILRAISALVAAMQVKERASREHALLSYVFAQKSYPPGLFRYYVTLVTEESVYADALGNSATEEQFRTYRAVGADPVAQHAASMRKAALETTDDTFEVDPAVWFEVDGVKIEALRRFERQLSNLVEKAAVAKIAATRRSIYVSGTLVGVVLVLSLGLAAGIARGINRSVNALGKAAATVRAERNYSVRAVKTSRDELGLLTDAFNEMLAGIQERDSELEQHRENLEHLVAQRTRELSVRNDDMRVVLDNVDQGLVTIDCAGNLSVEHSRRFEQDFGSYPSGTPFYRHLSDDEETCLLLRLGFEQLAEGIIPFEVAAEQIPRELVRGDSHFMLAFKPLLRDERLERVLLVVTDVTAEVAARRAEAAQREQVRTFERVMHDRSGFVEFFLEARTLAERIRDGRFADDLERMRAVHTLKGNAALFDVTTVSTAAHEYEQATAEGNASVIDKKCIHLLEAWDVFAQRVVPMLGEDFSNRVEIREADIAHVLGAVRAHKPHGELEWLLQRLQFEPMSLRFERIVHQIVSLAKRLNKGEPEVVVESNDVRLPLVEFSPFWAAFVHVVRNTVDHGFESPEERRAKGKPERNKVRLVSLETRGEIIIEIHDDGKGIDWARIAELGKARGMTVRSRQDAIRVLLAPGVSTARQVSSVSGRGVGMSEVAAMCRQLGGSMAIESETGHGTRLRFTFPSLEGKNLAHLPKLSARPISLRPSAAPTSRT